MTAAARPVSAGSPDAMEAARGAVRRNLWLLGLLAFLAILLVFTKIIQPNYGPTGVQGLAVSVAPLALAAVAQAIVVISGGIDLSIGAMMAFTNVVAAQAMRYSDDSTGVAIAIGVLLLGFLIGAINGALIVATCASPTSSSRWPCRSCGAAARCSFSTCRAARLTSG